MEELRAAANFLHDGKGNRIDVLCRLYPLDLLLRKLDRTPGGRLLTDLIENHSLAVVNPPSSYLLENKAVQAVIWGLCQTSSNFTADGKTLISKHFLATYLDPIRCGKCCVAKPAYGREGDSVKILARGKNSTWSNGTSTYSALPHVYQEYAALPQVKFVTEVGTRKLSILISCFLLDGELCGIGARAGFKITDNSAWFLPFVPPKRLIETMGERLKIHLQRSRNRSCPSPK